MKSLIQSSFWFLVSLFPVLSFAYSSHESIVSEFIRYQDSQENEEEEFVTSHYKKEYYVDLHKIIPVSVQRLIRKKENNKLPLTFKNMQSNVDLRSRDTPIVSQVGGRCTAYGLIASIENLLNSPINKLSESHLWYSYHAYSSSKAVEAAKRMAITEYAMWPANKRNPLPGWKEKAHTSLENISFLEDSIVDTVEALNQGRPVFMAMSVTYSMTKCDVVMDPYSKNNGGGHAVSISGYVLDERVPGGGYFIIKNSWGPNCGDKGYQYMPFNYCIRGGSSYCVMWDIEGVKTAFPGVPSVIPETPPFDLRKINLTFSTYKSWFSRYRTITMKVTGRSLHAKQIKEISYSIDGGKFSTPKKNDLDSVVMSFKTRERLHQVTLQITLKNGEIITDDYQWPEKR